MNEFIEKLIGRLEEYHCENEFEINGGFIEVCIDIVNQLAEEYEDNVMINEQYCWQTCGATEHCKECNRLCNGSIDYYENYDVLAEEYNNGWIPCSERLPEPKKAVLVSTNTGEVDVDYYGLQCKDFIGLKGTHMKAIAWQPLPPKYEPKGE